MIYVFFIDKIYFSDDSSRNFLLFQSSFNIFTILAGITEKIIAWKSKGLSNENTKLPATANNSLSSKLK